MVNEIYKIKISKYNNLGMHDRACAFYIEASVILSQMKDCKVWIDFN